MLKTVAIAEIDQRELQLRLIEAMYRVRRPPGPTLTEALAAMDEEDREMSRAGAVAALEYFQECIAKAQRVS